MNNSFLFLLITFLSFSLNSGEENAVINCDSNVYSNPIPENDEINILTYNVMGTTFKSNERVPALLNIIRDSDADVIALQEVDRGFVNAIINDTSIANKYSFSSYLLSRIKGGLLFLSKFEIVETSYFKLPETRLNRYLLIMEIVINNETFNFTTVHLDSYLEDGERRAKQLDFILKKMTSYKNKVILGDFNFGDLEEPETSHIDSSYSDIWIELTPNNKGYTWNMEESNMALRGSFPTEKSRRLDRILMDSDSWTFHSCEIVGNKPLIENSKDLFASDHYGLIGTLVRKEE